MFTDRTTGRDAMVNPPTYYKQSYHMFSRKADLNETGEESMKRVEMSWALVGAVGLRSRRRMARDVKHISSTSLFFH